MNLHLKITELSNALDSIENELFNINKTKYHAIKRMDRPDIMDVDFFERVLNSLSIIYKVRMNLNDYKLETWFRNSRFGGNNEPYYAIIDKKGIKRYEVNKEFWVDGDLWVNEIIASYGCNIVATIENLRGKAAKRESIHIQQSYQKVESIIYEDANEAFIITTGSLLADKSNHLLQSAVFTLDNILRINYWFEERAHLQKWNEHSVCIDIKLPEWEIVEKSVQTETWNYK